MRRVNKCKQGLLFAITLSWWIEKLNTCFPCVIPNLPMFAVIDFMRLREMHTEKHVIGFDRRVAVWACHGVSSVCRRSSLLHEYSLHERVINVKRIINYFLLHYFHVHGMLCLWKSANWFVRTAARMRGNGPSGRDSVQIAVEIAGTIRIENPQHCRSLARL